MGHKPLSRMPRQDRAKQFMPFAALKGLPEAIAKKERITVRKIELSECMAEELNRKFLLLERGKMVLFVSQKDCCGNKLFQTRNSK